MGFIGEHPILTTLGVLGAAGAVGGTIYFVTQEDDGDGISGKHQLFQLGKIISMDNEGIVTSSLSEVQVEKSGFLERSLAGEQIGQRMWVLLGGGLFGKAILVDVADAPPDDRDWKSHTRSEVLTMWQNNTWGGSSNGVGPTHHRPYGW